MGTPEFPDLGKHCTVHDCKQIDFLPFTCDRCLQVFCLEHRSYVKHKCSKADRDGITVVICPLCAKGVCLNPDEDPNISWETHVNNECDPSNYEKVTKKRKCPVPGCREVLTFSNTIKCRDCAIDHCLKHRFGTEHNCTGPRRPVVGFPFMGLLGRSKKEDSKLNCAPYISSSKWATSFLSAASTARASAEAGVAKLGTEISQAWQTVRNGVGQSSSQGSDGTGPEECPQCGARFSLVTTLVEHVQKVHERNGSQSHVLSLPVDVCPKCSRGFRDPAALVEHVERDHRGTSKA